MAKAYSDDLRRKLLEAHPQGEESLEELAERFCVSVGWAKKISALFGSTGRMERPPSGPRGPRSKITPEVQQHLRWLVATQSDLTLAEMQQRLRTELRLPVSLSRLWTVLRQMGLGLKKVAPRLRARYRSGPSAPPALAQPNPSNRSGTSDFPGREWRDHGDDTALRPGAPRTAGARRDPSRTLADPHLIRGYQRFRLGGDDDH